MSLRIGKKQNEIKRQKASRFFVFSVMIMAGFFLFANSKSALAIDGIMNGKTITGETDNYLLWLQTYDPATSPYFFDEFFIDKTGNVGIGTSAPGVALHVRNDSSATAAMIRLETQFSGAVRTLDISSGAGLNWSLPAGTSQSPYFMVSGGLQTAGGGGLDFRTNGANSRLFIQQDGNIGIGTTVPNDKFSIGNAGSAPAGSANTGHNFTSTYLATDDYALVNYGLMKTVLVGGSNSLWSGAKDGTIWNGTSGAGSVGIGTTVPRSSLSVLGSAGRIDIAKSYSDTATGATVPSRANMYMIVGGQEYNNGTYRGIGFGYNMASHVNVPAYIASIDRGVAGYTHSDLVFATRNVDTDTQATERMIIRSDGNVGVGTTNPGSKLEINGGSQAVPFRITNSNWVVGSTGTEIRTDFGATSGDTWVGWNVLKTGETAWGNLVLQSGGGNVGIGTTAPGSKLQVEGDIMLASSGSSIGNGNYRAIGIPQASGNWTGGGANVQFWQGGNNANSNYITFNTNNSGVSAGERMRLTETGNVGINTTAPNDKLSIGNAGAAPAGSANTGHNYTSTYLATDDYALANYGLVKTLIGNATSSLVAGSLWNGTLNGNIYNGAAGAGNVGIGVVSPIAKLDVAVGNTTWSGWNSYAGSGAVAANLLTGPAAQKINARATAFAYVSGKNPGTEFSLIMAPWDGVNTLETNCNNQVNAGWHAQVAIKGNYFTQTFDNTDFTQYSSVIGSQASFDSYKANGTQWWIACSTLPAFSNNSASGSGTANYITKWTGANSQGNSIVFDNGTNVGVGHNNPNYKLDVNGIIYSNNGFRVHNNGADVQNGSGYYFANAANNRAWNMQPSANGDFAFFGYDGSSWAEKMRILTNGNVGINTTAPNDKLSIGNAGSAPAGSANTGHNFTSTYLATDDYALANYGIVKTLVNNSSSNIVIGGRNYIKFTGNPYLSVSGWGETGWSGNLNVDTTENALQLTSINGWHDMYYDTGITNTQVTVSGEVKWKQSQSGNLNVGFRNSHSIGEAATATYSVAANTSTYTKFVFTYNADTNSFFSIDSRNIDSGGLTDILLIRKLKFEIGNKATDWTPSPDELVKMNSAGNVGIGTTNPGMKLSVQATNSAQAFEIIGASGGYTNIDLTGDRTSGNLGGLRFRRSGDAQSFFEMNPQADKSATYFSTGDGVAAVTPKITLLQGGNVGIGMTNPGTKLDVKSALINGIDWNIRSKNPYNNNSTGWGTGIRLENTDTSLNNWAGIASVSEADWSWNTGLAFYTGYQTNASTLPTEKVRITGSGNFGIGTTAPNDSFSIGNAGSAPAGSSKTGHNFTSTYLATDDYALANYGLVKTLIGNATSTLVAGNLWNGTLNGNIYNGAAGAGNVGVGTNNPLNRLDVYNDSATYNPTSYNLAGMTLRTAAAAGDFSGIRFTAAGARESFFGVVEGAASNKSNFVFQGYDGTSLSYKEFMRINDTGNVGIGTTNPTAKLNVYQSQSGLPDQSALVKNNLSFNSSANGNTHYGVYTDVQRDGWSNVDTYGTYSIGQTVTRNGAGNTYGIAGIAKHTMNYTIMGGAEGSLIGVLGGANIGFVQATAPLANMFALYAKGANVDAGASATNAFGVYVNSPTGAGTITNKYALVTEAGAGNVGIGTTNPISDLQVGSATFTGAYGSYDNSRVGLLVGNGAGSSGMVSLQVSSTYNDPTTPNYGLVLVNGPSTASYDTWGIMHDGPANASGGLKFAYGAQGSNIHAVVPMVTFQKSGNVGINTTAPNDKLSIGNAGAAPAGSANTGHNFTSTYLATDDYALVNYGLMKTVLSGGSGALWGGTKDGNIWNGTSGAGNVGIGTNGPTEKLEINGIAKAQNGDEIGYRPFTQFFMYDTVLHNYWNRVFRLTPSTANITFQVLIKDDRNYADYGLYVVQATKYADTNFSIEVDRIAGNNTDPFYATIDSSGYVWIKGTGAWSYFAGYKVLQNAGTDVLTGASILTQEATPEATMETTPSTYKKAALSGGIFTINPSYSGFSDIVRSTTGSIGIGAVSPGSKLEVRSSSNAEITLNRIGSWGSSPSGIKMTTDDAGTDYWRFGMLPNSTNNLYLNRNSTSFLMVDSNSGNVGIGTTNPLYKLETNGTFKASANSSSIILDASGNISIGL
jgi:hypothetical protein